MTRKARGADILAQALVRAGTRYLFSLSGNQIMPVYDAAIDAKLEIVHTRHEGAAVHMADAWGRLTGEPGVAIVTGGPGHANAVSALYTALASDSPMVLLSGHAPRGQLGKGAFQEMRQADMAAPVAKASWTAQSAAGLGHDMARAFAIARSGRPGPVHVSLPFDVLEAAAGDAATLPEAAAFAGRATPLGEVVAATVIAQMARAKRPLVIGGPQLGTDRGRAAAARLRAATGVPVVCMESPRGIADPALGAFADVLGEADLVVLLGKPLDFTLRFGQTGAFAADCRFIAIDSDVDVIARDLANLGNPGRMVLTAVADTLAAADALTAAAGNGGAHRAWADEVAAAIAHRPAGWGSLKPRADGPVHPVEVGRAVQSVIDAAPEAVLVADGGEFGQWAQACVSAPTRILNGPAGSIGSALPFALAARLARPQATVVALLGDGTFGFHAAEFDTAVRAQLAFVAVVGNDACWNAEHQIQLRTYGPQRTVGCELLPTRYDQVVAAFGGHGEHVVRAADLPAALGRAVESQRPACVNVALESLPAPTVSRRAAPAGGGAH